MSVRSLSISALFFLIGINAALAQEQFDRFGGYKGITSPTHKSYSGAAGTLEAQKLTDPKASFPQKGLVGKYIELLPGGKAIEPDVKVDPKGFLTSDRVKRFRIVKNTATELFTDPADGDMTKLGKAGDGYRTSGFFTTEKIGNRWWFITPDGHPFIVLGVSVIAKEPLDGNDKSGKRYFEYIKAKYSKEGDSGNEWIRRWSDKTLDRLQGWGFNTIGTFSYDVQALRRVPYYATLRVTNYAVIGKTGPCGNATEGTDAGGFFPDIYNPKLVPFMEDIAKNFAAVSKDDPWVVGLFVDQMDELRGFDGGHANLGYMAIRSFDQITCGILDKPAAEGGKRTPVHNYFKDEMVKFLQQRYKDKIGDLNAAWGTSFASFDEIAAKGKTLGIDKDGNLKGQPKVKEDMDAFEEKVAEDYTRLTTTAIRKYDPNHVIFSPNFAAKYKPAVLKGMVKGGGFDCYGTQWPAETYEIVKRPMLGAPDGVFLTADSDSPLRLEGKIDKVEMIDLPRNPGSLKVYDYDRDIWWVHKGNITPISFTDVPKVRKEQSDPPWQFQLIGTGKDEDGKSWFAVRSSGGHLAGYPKELEGAVNKMLAEGKTPHYKRYSMGDCRDQADRAAKWAAQIESMAVTRAPGGDYFRVGHNWWKYSDNGWTYWVERYNFGLVTLKDNAYNGKEATKAGGEDADYGDLLTGVTKANKGVYQFTVEHDAKDKASATQPGTTGVK